MAIPMKLPNCFFLLLLAAGIFTPSSSRISPSDSPHSSPALTPRSLTVKLIHRNSVSSLYHNHNSSQWDLAMDSIETSIDRARYFNKRIIATKKSGYAINQDGGTTLVPDFLALAFLARVSIGDPPLEQLVSVDTASTLLWVHCAPCLRCPKQVSALFTPANSKTYSGIPCTRDRTRPCDDAGGKCDDSQNRCSFNESYYDGSLVSGDLASERLVFGSEEDGKIDVTVKVFGCAHDYSGETDFQQSGVLGLGFSSISLANQLGGKFSFCFGDIRDHQYPYNKLIFGEGANLEGAATPIVSMNEGFYYVGLEGISVGEEKLNTDPSVFKLQSSGGGGTILDTGSTLTHINKAGYDPLFNKVASILDKSLQRTDFSVNGVPLLCYKGKVDRDIKNFPVVTLHFAGGADIVLDTTSLLFQVDPATLCMAVAPAFEDGMSIIGIRAQQYYSIGYDVPAGKAYIQKIDCRLLQS